MADAADAGGTAPAEFRADAAWRAVDILSDVHLSADAPATFDAWAAHLRSSDADAVLLLGDLFEVWVGDDARHDAFEARCVDALREAAARKRLAFMAGNRDFLFGAQALADAGMTRLNDPTVLVAFGQRTLLTHGDAWCLADVDYQRFRREVRDAGWQRAFLARPLDERRRIARQMRDASRQHQRRQPMAAADVDPATALAELHRAQATTLIHGHTHRPGHEHLAPGVERWVTSDWDFERGATRGDVLRVSAAGIERIAPRTGA
jgi:UDP-2,3-diacylglucosamine hydrolase